MACLDVKGITGILYPMGTTPEKAAYYFSAASSVSLFVLNCLTLCGINIPDIGWINLGLSVGGFTAALAGGLWKHKVGIYPLGLGREIVQTLPLFVLSLLGALGVGGCSAEMMSKGIVITLAISAALTYGPASCAVKYFEKNKQEKNQETRKRVNQINEDSGNANNPTNPQSYQPISDDMPDI